MIVQSDCEKFALLLTRSRGILSFLLQCANLSINKTGKYCKIPNMGPGLKDIFKYILGAYILGAPIQGSLIFRGEGFCVNICVSRL